jgi:hypothetical protein
MMIRRRQDGRIIKRVDDELVIYDQDTHKVFHLNKAAAIVWEHCEDAASLDELSHTLASHSGLPASEDLTGLALQELRDAELIEGSFASAAGREVARREVMMRMAGMALALPLVVSLLAPTPSMAASQGDPKIPAPIKYEPRFPSWWRWPWHW